MTTDTPRTDLKELELSEVKYPHDFYALGDLCRELERELNASQAESESRRQSLAFTLSEIKKSEAEAEFYKKSVKAYVHACEPIRGMADKLGLQLGECIIQHGVPLLLESHKKAEAEVERLREDNQKLRARLNYVQGCDCDNYLHPYCNKLTK
jgi:hypothetical protein